MLSYQGTKARRGGKEAGGTTFLAKASEVKRDVLDGAVCIKSLVAAGAAALQWGDDGGGIKLIS